MNIPPDDCFCVDVFSIFHIFITGLSLSHLQANGYKLSLECLDDLGLSDMKDRILEIVRKMKELKIDENEYTCLKFLILLNPGMVKSAQA